MKIPSKADLILWGLVGLAAAGVIVVIAKWKHDAGLLRVERAEHEAELTKIRGELANERHNAQLARESSDAYQAEKEKLERDRAATPVRVVRLCRAASNLPGAAGGSATPGEEAVPDPAGSDPQVGRDIGPELYALADEADECAVQRDALIDWIRKTTPAQ